MGEVRRVQRVFVAGIVLEGGGFRGGPDVARIPSRRTRAGLAPLKARRAAPALRQGSASPSTGWPVVASAQSDPSRDRGTGDRLVRRDPRALARSLATSYKRPAKRLFRSRLENPGTPVERVAGDETTIEARVSRPSDDTAPPGYRAGPALARPARSESDVALNHGKCDSRRQRRPHKPRCAQMHSDAPQHCQMTQESLDFRNF